ncbi:hypothetical protein [Companilactobacillus sp.]|jgi:hypothetical protein|uniref:hypothetical protein n=1 Tax=Companilactobacillus sp. TaxID=2767905 RepID=UPI0025C7105D|nr:hypothetical protein [Companilactobacillus sp.]MCH4009639.1 hypothetical protein [Companilactobacillus sp.]MCH4052685.1 hypothetical protein [Companilactobacillus sp.]MCH4077581.1 hypothetical protein [Companilactobacillus sp.]MCH4126157.1 hypothetical protein [Companilactobacillus sp.]MCI1311865.1 hypothetical protein [Companilactobacillus sp.]
MKKLGILFLGIILSFTLVACSSNNSSSTESKPIEFRQLSKADRKNVKFKFDLKRAKDLDYDPKAPLDNGGPSMRFNVTIHNNTSKNIRFYNNCWMVSDGMDDWNNTEGYPTNSHGSQIVKSHSTKTLKDIISGHGTAQLGLLSKNVYLRYENILLYKGSYQSYFDLINKLEHNQPGDPNYKTIDNAD